MLRCPVCKTEIVPPDEFVIIKKRVAYYTKGVGSDGAKYATDRVAKGWRFDVRVHVRCMNDPRGVTWRL